MEDSIPIHAARLPGRFFSRFQGMLRDKGFRSSSKTAAHQRWKCFAPLIRSISAVRRVTHGLPRESDMSNSETAVNAALDFRDELLGMNWPGDNEVARFAGPPASADAGEFTARARGIGALLGVWSAPQRAFVYPAFQFDQSGKPVPEVIELLALLPKEGDEDGWRRAFWLYSPHAYLGDQSPADVFTSDPVRVLRVALEEFHGDPGTAW